MDKMILKHGAETFLDFTGLGVVNGIVRRFEEYHRNRKNQEAEKVLNDLFYYLCSLKRCENRTGAEAYINSVFTPENNLSFELLDDLLIQLLNTPNELTRSYIVWIYAKYVYHRENTPRIAIRLVRLLLDCDQHELQTLKDLTENMQKNWVANIERAVLSVNIDQPGDIPAVYMSRTTDIPKAFKPDEWVKWPTKDFNYSAMLDMLKRNGVTRDVPLSISRLSTTKSQMYLIKEVAELLFFVFSIPDVQPTVEEP